jgi:hypothetical protein
MIQKYATKRLLDSPFDGTLLSASRPLLPAGGYVVGQPWGPSNGGATNGFRIFTRTTEFRRRG